MLALKILPTMNGTRSSQLGAASARNPLEQHMSLSNFTQFGERPVAMQVALSLACRELGIGEADQSKRATVAILMTPLAKRGPVSIDRLKTFAVSQYRMSK